MKAKVLAWSDLGSLEEALAHEADFDSAIHLCATYSLFRGLSKVYGHKISYALTIGQLIDSLCPQWFTARTQLEHYVQLTGILRHLNQSSPANARELRALRRGQRAFLDALRDLVQAGLAPGDVQPSSNVEKMACRAWELLEQKPGFSLPRTMLYEEFVRTPSAFSKALAGSLNEVLGKAGTGFNQALVILHGFYFITPIQFQLMRLLEASGARLVFCNFYDARFPGACRAWESFFEPGFGLPPPYRWIHYPPSREPTMFAAQFGDALTGKDYTGTDCTVTRAEGVVFEEYNELSGFARVMSARQSGAQPFILLSPDSEELTDRLAEFIPEAAAGKHRHLLSYPVGRFLLHLHRMWNQEQASLDIDEIALLECIGSGWMRLDGQDARGFLPVVERLLPYFIGCRSLDEWLERVRQLHEARQALIVPFISQCGPAAIPERDHRFLASPFERLSFFAVPDDEIKAFTRLLLELRCLAQSLFASAETTVVEHFRKLEQLLQDCIGQSMLYDEERRLLEVLSTSLLEAQSVELSVPREDLCEAVTLFLSGSFEQGQKDKKDSRVRRFSELDGVPLEECGKAELHLAMCDDELLPHRYVGIAWPFARESVQPATAAGRQSKMLLAAREESALDADVLLLFQAAALGSRLTISWIRRRGDKELRPSPLLLPILEFGPYPIQNPQEGPLGLLAPFSSSSTESTSLARSVGPHPPHALATWRICPRRFFYDFVLADGPEWRSEFHHSFLLGNIVRGIEQQFQLGGQVLKHLMQYLPHWPEARLKAACDSTSNPPDDRFMYRGRSYPRILDRLLLFRSNEPDAANIRQTLNGSGQAGVLSELDNQLSLDEGSPLPPARPSSHCTLCPNQHHCDSALFHHELTDT